jgi:DNA-binding SARP family transcriptional activator
VTVSGGGRQVGVLGGLGLEPAQRLSGVGRRVLAYLAVKGPVAHRPLMCMDLWPDLPEERARANLRRALWQLPPGWVHPMGPELYLDAEVDLVNARRLADQAIASDSLEAHEVAILTRDLLPGWYEEWVVVEQDQFHLRRIQALEATCRTATDRRQYGLATSAGLAAVSAEPLRESAVTALIEAHLCEGNVFEALRRFHVYRTLLKQEIAANPGNELAGLVSPFIESNSHTSSRTSQPGRRR